MECPRCLSPHVRRSHRVGFWETGFLTFFHYYPFRCRDCGHRYHHFHQSRNRSPKGHVTLFGLAQDILWVTGGVTLVLLWLWLRST
ncbi:MAG: hypothetical protein K1Y36_14860 [Blastocatellia bacterium]|nr:hypothetical protein [Blastocatellia bacterium]